MDLGDLITTLENANTKAVVELVWLKDGEKLGSPYQLDSWRGVYAHLALEYTDREVRVPELLAEACKAVGHTFHGYKGGDFTMDKSTPVWVSQYGEAHHWAIVGSLEGTTLNGEPLLQLIVADIYEYWF